MSRPRWAWSAWPARSHAVAVAAHRGIDPAQEAAHVLERPHRDELDPVFVGEGADLLAGLETEPLPDLPRNNHLEFRRDRDRVHRNLERCRPRTTIVQSIEDSTYRQGTFSTRLEPYARLETTPGARSA